MRKIIQGQRVAWSQPAQKPFSVDLLQNTDYATRSIKGDGDSKSYSCVKNAQPPVYDNTDITKLECCGHVQKPISELKKTPFVHNGKTVKGIGGRGGLKKTAILKIQGHYGAAIRNNVGDLPAMKKAVWAIWEHRNRQHDSCGTWCPSKTADSGDHNKNALLPYVMEAIKPIFSTLADDSLLEKCLHGGTSRSTISYGNVAPKQPSVGAAGSSWQ